MLGDIVTEANGAKEFCLVKSDGRRLELTLVIGEAGFERKIEILGQGCIREAAEQYHKFFHLYRIKEQVYKGYGSYFNLSKTRFAANYFRERQPVVKLLALP
jgi:hypothetical protein